MKYKELIHFEPIETVVQLREASQNDYAFNLLDTYVISERMAEMIDEIIIEQLQFNRPADNKGLLIVGNYGTGKSHLMSVIGTISEVEGSCERVSNERVAKRAKEIEGKFKVIRSEIGATTMSLRDFVCEELRDNLLEMGIDFSFPSMDKVRSNKDSFIEMMGKFNEAYPDKGLLLIVDELLDYLRSRKTQELILDLGFLREVGEICRFTRFRFISGIQEMLFDNPKFQFVAEQIRRVKERFEQVSIVREDIAYVVSQRLLKKDDKQKALIREHIQKFTSLYDKLNERIEEYVELFPVHPAYLATFEKVIVAEKRVILKTISNEMKKLLEQDVPEEKPGLISYDSYWQYIENDTSLKSDPDIRKVMTKSKILQDRIQNAFTKPVYKPIALRIVRALSVNRLTTGDIYTKLGITSEELRDTLFLYADMPEQEAGFLRTTIETVLKEILKTVSWQYISFNEANGQYYIDINKDIPVDEIIEQKSETLIGDQLDRYYFEVLEQLTDRSKNTYVTGYRIWEYELPWYKCKVNRGGYLFFGAPNDRSTAHPPRDFYIYMLQMFDIPKFKDENKPDEVFFKLKVKDESFIRSLKLYAASKEMAATAPSGTKKLYEEKGIGYLQDLTKWLRENFLSAYELTYKGETKKVVEWTKALPPHSGVREIIENAGTVCLSHWFDEKYPEYPHFSKLNTVLTKDNMPTYIQDVYKYFAGAETRSGAAILEGFVMIEEEKIKVHSSGYAKWIIKLLEDKGQGQVVNRSEIIETIYTMQGTKDVELTKNFRIEPELFSVVLVALVYNGDIMLTINGTQYDAMKLNQLIKLPINDITDFSHLKRPSGLPLPALKALFDLLDLSQGLLQQHSITFGVVQMNEKANKLLNEAVTTIQTVKTGIPCWDGTVLTAAEQQQYFEVLDRLKAFLESLLIYNTPAKLNNFKHSINEIDAHKKGIELLEKIKKLQQKVNETSSLANYIITAGQHLPMEHNWQEDAQIALEDLLHVIKNQSGYQTEFAHVQDIKKKYQDIYMEMHSRARLNASEDNRKTALLSDKKFAALKQLSSIELLPAGHFELLVKNITSLKTCWSLTQEELNKQTFCPNCKFRPKEELTVKGQSLEDYEEQVQDMLEEWTRLLLNNFKDDEVKENISLLDKGQQRLINDFLSRGEFSLPIDANLIESIKILLQGIEKIGITFEELKDMIGNGSPVTVEDVRFRFERLLKDKVGNHQTGRVRIMLENIEKK
jgi:uncharacterized protein YihD (DUF1040 family)